MPRELNFKMLIIARESRGYTQGELVDKIPNLSQGNYSRMEKGMMQPTDETIRNLAAVLDFPESFFYKSGTSANNVEYFYRKRVSTPKKELTKLEANFDLIRLWFEDLLNEVEIGEFKFPELKVEGMNTAELIARKSKAVADIPPGPIINMVGTMEKNGIIIHFLQNAPEKFDGTTLICKSGQKIIVVNSDIPNDRKRFTIAHELGHCIMHIPFSSDLDPYSDIEKEANLFAAEFLMPALEIKRDLVALKFRDLADLKNYWRVSKVALIKRAHTLGLINQSRYTTFMIEISRAGERRIESNDVELDDPRILKLILKALTEQLDYTMESISEMLGMSINDYNFFFQGNKTKTKLRIAL
ncbi:XRE family transcriptional regulator [Mucilaginibacter dorajii]|uniref:XRE family transcriptional regulator n=1 Tax=Mucilaginibacter dorajii TaxID=692994 RepID=A0ABP7Q1F2_9SPHI|nr:XRE family transcriptional regulator [Mucilaginibacter dorajii]MCS3732859.1 Zn-dependent peptidase ImmA (M78 family)/transcriptional regulator with XRE-family HTH domain [Mucilaginibacter dorajii]